ncbi:hypothetical protein [Sphingomonas sp. ID0503]|uniref:hypothetical protein n=1 Tax=Sphingomonas sp. ID0503 TaxID=3399691 RepID=UPI003AFB45DE
MRGLALAMLGLLTTTSAMAGEVETFLRTTSVTDVDAAALTARCTAAETLARRLKGELEGHKGAATVAKDFAAYDRLVWQVSNIAGEMSLISETAPAKDAEPAVAYTLSRALLGYRLSGVDKDAATWAKAVLNAGSTMSADDLVKTFLGRPWTPDALRDQLKPLPVPEKR